MSQKFRYDINGLRAYAVALVVLFHFGILGFSGGFIGVDIFFVISGFLMTKIIVSGIENNKFDFFKFLISRANRIIPALVFLILIVTCMGWFTLLPQEFKDYSKHAITSMGFVSNLQYFRESGYFDASSHEKLLLHTWSLSVEWQFYVILPLVMLLIHKLFKNIKILKALYLLGFIVSFGLSIYISQVNQSAAFYLLPTRAWEMMAGGLIFLFLSNNKFNTSTKKMFEWTGLGLILFSTIYFTGESVWPGYNALLPVVGTFLVLLAANNQSIFTNNKIAQFLGNTSYSIYLWHWPIVFYLGYFEKQNNALWIVFAIGLSILLGWLSYRFIETPTRKGLSSLNLKSSYAMTTVYTSVPIVILAFIFIEDGYSARLNTNAVSIALSENDKNPRRDECHISSGVNIPQCTYGGNKVGAIVIGDSHAQAIIRSVEKALPSPALSVLDWTYSSCPTIKSVVQFSNPKYQCAQVLDFILLEKHKYKNTPIIVTNRLNTYLEGDQIAKLQKPQIFVGERPNGYDLKHKTVMTNRFVETICELSKTNPVYITSQIPEHYYNVPKYLAHKAIFNDIKDGYIPLKTHLNRSQSSLDASNMALKKCGAKILDVTPYLCHDDKCYASLNKKPLYYDDDHLSVYGADQLIPLFKKIF